MATVNIPGVELVKAGTWDASTGRVTITNTDLTDMATASRDTNIDHAINKLGHVDPRFDGEPALGRVTNLRLSSDGGTLIGDLVDVPSQLVDILTSAYPRRSVEIQWGMKAPWRSRRGAVPQATPATPATPGAPAAPAAPAVDPNASAGTAPATPTDDPTAPAEPTVSLPVAAARPESPRSPRSTSSAATTSSPSPCPRDALQLCISMRS